MKIQNIYLNNVGPIDNQIFDFYDDWNDKIFSRILFSGPNGSGKSLVFRAIAEIWQATGYWLDNRKKLPNNKKKWLQQNGIAIILRELPNVANPVGIIYGDKNWFERLEIKDKYPKIEWIGELTTNKKSDLLLTHEEWFNNWSKARKKLIVDSKSTTPNMIYMDAEECRWVSPNRNIGETLPENSSLRWLVKYQVSEDWQGQLEHSLLNLKLLKLHKYHEVIRHLNRFLYDKEINSDVKQQEGQNRLQVNIKKQGQSHTLDMLSSGERQMLIKLYLIIRWLEPGGIVMIDEPDLYLHPSIIPDFLAKLELQVKEKEGQLLIASHSTDIWNRYDTRNKRIKL
ncbi:MAG: ATP-binding protein [Candidatus Marithrix sp.]